MCVIPLYRTGVCLARTENCGCLLSLPRACFFYIFMFYYLLFILNKKIQSGDRGGAPATAIREAARAGGEAEEEAERGSKTPP